MDEITVRDNDFYTIKVSIPKNRTYLKIKGFWRHPDLVPDYLDDWNNAMSYLEKGFTLRTDASEMKTHPQSVAPLHEQAQAILIKNGVSKVAEILSDEIAALQLNAVAKKTNFPKENFQDLEAAEKWLDS